jgi:hypothetical protein
MAITQAISNSFKQELMQAQHNFSSSGGHTFWMSLYPSTATLSASTTAYVSSGEITGTNYTAGGKALTMPASMPGLTGATAWTDFNDPVWSTSTLTNVRGAQIYNASASNKSVVALDFGSDKSSSAGDFTVVFPAGDSTNAIIRIN